MAQKKRPQVLLQYDLGDLLREGHRATGEDSMLRKEHGDATVGDAPTAESFRQKVQAMERGEDRRAIEETPAAPAPPPAPRLTPSDILRAAVYGDTIFSRPPGAAYFQRRRNRSSE
ncbi:MAG: hypothetical protein QM758_19030 [Armatimonas sp.]